MKLRTKLLNLFSLIMLFTLLTSCGTTKNDGTFETILKNKTIVIGTESGYPPYEFLDSNGNLQGLDIEIAKLIAKEIGEQNDITVKVVFKDMDFEGLLGALSSGQIDMIAAAYSVSPDRQEVVDFSNIYIEEKPVIVVKATSDILTLDAILGKKVGAQLGTTMASIAEEYANASDITTLKKNIDLIMQLKTGTLDAVILESTVAANYIENNTDLKLATAEFSASEDGGYAYAIQKNQPQLLAVINTVIDELIASGEIGELFDAASELAAQ